MLPTITRVFSNGWYTLLCAGVFFVGMSLTLLLPNLVLIGQIITSDAIDVGAKLAFIATFYGSIVTNFTVFSAVYSLTLIGLFALNVTLFIYYVRRAQLTTKGIHTAHTSSAAGLVTGVLGIGCAACGSVILTGLFTSLGASGLLLFSPLQGGELALIGIGFLAWSISYLIQKINDPQVCRIDV